jgi:hydroxymethylbilane synthase
MPALRLGTRGSALALWQANHVAALIRAQPGAPPVELVQIRTEGDARTDVPLWQVGGRAFFTREIDRALVAGEVDLAVHSLKDLATTLEPGLKIAAVLEREDPRDALVAVSFPDLAALPQGARVGTSSLRRRAFLKRARRDLELEELRGNVPTRLDKLKEGKYQAIILAVAGLKRLGLEQHVTAHLDPWLFPPAVSQGAIAVCTRTEDAATAPWLEALDHGPTHLAITAERALLKKLEGGCQVPLGALATLEGGQMTLTATVCSLDGHRSLSARGGRSVAPSAELAPAVALGEQVAQDLLDQGAGSIIAEQRQAAVVEEP